MKASKTGQRKKTFVFATSVLDMTVQTPFLSGIDAAMQTDMPLFENIL
jgi:hypothetical protein